MTREEIIAWSDEATRRITPELLSKAPLSEKQRKRSEQLREEARIYCRQKETGEAFDVGKAKAD